MMSTQECVDNKKNNIKCINNIISINKLNTLLFWWSTSDSCVSRHSDWSWQILSWRCSFLSSRSRDSGGKDKLSPEKAPPPPSIAHHRQAEHPPNAAADNDQTSAVRTSCFMFRRPAETTTWNSPGRKDSVYFPGDLRKRIMSSCWVDFFSFGTKLFTDQRGQRCDVFRGAETFWSPPTDHRVYVKKWTHWYYTVSDLSE